MGNGNGHGAQAPGDVGIVIEAESIDDPSWLEEVSPQDAGTLILDEPPFISLDAASEFLDAIGSGAEAYMTIMVRYAGSMSREDVTVRYREYSERYNRYVEKAAAYENDHSAMRRKAHHVGCRSCDSRLSREHLTGNECPLCGAELRSQAVLDKIAWWRARIEKERQMVEREGEKFLHDIRWLIRTYGPEPGDGDGDE